jgi:hypothetical protein
MPPDDSAGPKVFLRWSVVGYFTAILFHGLWVMVGSKPLR